MKKYSLTRQQGNCLDFIKSVLKKGGAAPSYAEIQRDLGIKNKSGVHHLIVALESRGYISRLPGATRSITLVPDDVSGLKAISGAASAFVAAQTKFRQDFDADPHGDEAAEGASLVEAAFNKLRKSVEGM